MLFLFHGKGWKVRSLFQSMLFSLGTFTALPMPFSRWNEENTRHAMLFLPLCGALIGGLWAGISALINVLSLPLPVAATFVAVVPFLLTGFLHLDGFLDVCDALFSRRGKEERLRILKDPHIGSFAACSLAVLFIFQWGAAFAVVEEGRELLVLVLLPVFPRIFASLAVYALPATEGSSLAGSLKRVAPRWEAAVQLSLLALLIALCALLLPGALLPLAASCLVFCLCILRCVRAFGGISGDSLGFSITLAEAAAFLVFSLAK